MFYESLTFCINYISAQTYNGMAEWYDSLNYSINQTIMRFHVLSKRWTKRSLIDKSSHADFQTSNQELHINNNCHS